MKIHVNWYDARFNYPAGIFDVDSTSKFQCRKRVEKRKNISTVVEKALKFRHSTSNQRRNFNDCRNVPAGIA